MEIKEIKNKKTWNSFLLNFNDYTFLQSWQWGEINSGNSGKKVWRLAVFNKGKMMGIAQAFIIMAKRGKIFFVPHGPLFTSKIAWKLLIEEFQKIAIDNGCVCLRISPWELRSKKNYRKYKNYGFIEAGVIMHAEDTWLVDLKASDEELLLRMRKTTRNLIRRGIKDGLKISQSKNINDVNILYDLQMEVVKRNNFVPFSKNYLFKEMNILIEDDCAVLFLGEGSNGVVGAALIVFLGKYAFYYQSGSKETKEPVNYLLQWEVIKEAKRRKCEIYNMWGVAPDDSLNHPWRGLTIFKTGFGGELKKYMKAIDLPIKKIGYFKLRILEKVPKNWRQILTKRMG